MSNLARLLGFKFNKFYGKTFGEVDITEQLEQDLNNELMVEDELMFLAPVPKFRSEYYTLVKLISGRKRASRRIQARAQAITSPELIESFKSYKFDRLIIANVDGILFFDRANISTLLSLLEMAAEQFNLTKNSELINEFY